MRVHVLDPKKERTGQPRTCEVHSVCGSTEELTHNEILYIPAVNGEHVVDGYFGTEKRAHALI